jgi:PIN domain nuclease of toxin-antitoxin system
VIILDTHVWVRWLDPVAAPLPSWLIDKIESADTLAVSAVTCWEVAWLNRRGRIELALPLDAWLDQALQGSEVICLPVERHIAIRAALLPEHHRDPADRLIIASALENQAQLASFDQHFPAYVELAEHLIQR